MKITLEYVIIARELLREIKDRILQQNELNDFIAQKIDDAKGQDIVTLDVRGKSSITETMMICTGTSSRHVSSIANHIIDEAKLAGQIVIGSEGKSDADWVVVDLDTIIVHVMQEESRHLYDLEKLWS